MNIYVSNVSNVSKAFRTEIFFTGTETTETNETNETNATAAAHRVTMYHNTGTAVLMGFRLGFTRRKLHIE